MDLELLRYLIFKIEDNKLITPKEIAKAKDEGILIFYADDKRLVVELQIK